jgi:hypothetical protein
MKCFSSKIQKQNQKIKSQKISREETKAPTNNSTPKIFQQIFTEKIYRICESSKTGNF